MPTNLGWEITPGDYAEISRHPHWSDTPRMLESCDTCGHPRRVHDFSEGETCDVCTERCLPIGHPRHPQRHP